MCGLRKICYFLGMDSQKIMQCRGFGALFGRMMETFFKLCQSLGVPIADEKTEGPTTILVFLGLELDLELMEVRIPIDKVKQIVKLMEEVLQHKRSVTLREMQSIIGSLNFMCRAIVPGLPFCRRLINSTNDTKGPYHHIRLTKRMRQDLQTWLVLFQSFNGISIFHDTTWYSNTDVCQYTDSSAASGNGFGAYFQGRWAFGV